jgi:hypothetical protein
MAAAARALGWPEQIVDATRAQLRSITKMQIQMMDHMMDIWKEQIKSPNPMTAPSAMLSKLNSLPGAKPPGTWPNTDAFAGAAMNLQMAEQWQRAWADAAPPLITRSAKRGKWASFNRDGPSILLHRGTGDPYADHIDHAVCLGSVLPLRMNVLRTEDAVTLLKDLRCPPE